MLQQIALKVENLWMWWCSKLVLFGVVRILSLTYPFGQADTWSKE